MNFPAIAQDTIQVDVKYYDDAVIELKKSGVPALTAGTVLGSPARYSFGISFTG